MSSQKLQLRVLVVGAEAAVWAVTWREHQVQPERHDSEYRAAAGVVKEFISRIRRGSLQGS